jgi:hypothetical protein
MFRTLPNVNFSLIVCFINLNMINKNVYIKACLSGLIVVALIALLLEVRQIHIIYKRSKFEAVLILKYFRFGLIKYLIIV